MKKQTALILAAAMSVAALTSCTKPATTVFDDEPADETTEETEDPDGIHYSPGSPSHDLSIVRITETLPDYYLEEYDAPWGSKYDLRMADRTIETKCAFLTFDSNDEVCNENLNNISTITRPTVKVFPAEQEGYIMYEITYTQLIPLRSRQPSIISSDMFVYYDLDFVDYYTGTVFPWVNIFSGGGGSHIIQDYHYQDGTYRLEYYEFHEDEQIDEGTEYLDNDLVLRKFTIKRTTTSYLIVPEDYDGILMYVYVGDDVFWNQAETGEENQETVNKDRQPYNVYNAEPFGDEEHIDDYIFLGVTVPK